MATLSRKWRCVNGLLRSRIVAKALLFCTHKRREYCNSCSSCASRTSSTRGGGPRGGLGDTRQICRGHNQPRGTRGRNREAIQPIGDSRGSLF